MKRRKWMALMLCAGNIYGRFFWNTVKSVSRTGGTAETVLDDKAHRKMMVKIQN